jgi:hypothetical protein
MGEKIPADKLAAMRSVGQLRHGPTRHTSAGTIRTSVTETKTSDDFVRVTTDVNGAVITEYASGAQGVELHPQPIGAKAA